MSVSMALHCPFESINAEKFGSKIKHNLPNLDQESRHGQYEGGCKVSASWPSSVEAFSRLQAAEKLLAMQSGFFAKIAFSKIETIETSI